MSCGCASNEGLSERQKFIVCTQEREHNANNKVSIIGAGRIGSACAYTFLTQGITNDICLIDIDEAKLEGEMFDLLHASVALKLDTKVTVSKDFAASAESKVTVITVEAAGPLNSNRLALFEGNVQVLKKIIPEIVKYSPDTVIYVVSNPCDALAYAAWQLSGLPKTRVIGSGTDLDSARLRYHISKKFNIGVSACQAWMIGEHGDSMVPVWSGVTIGGVRLTDLNDKVGEQDDPGEWQEEFSKIVQMGLKLYKQKGSSAWGISAVACGIVRSILHNTNDVHAASVCVKGIYGIKDDVFLSLPIMVGKNGITDIIKLFLNDKELEGFRNCAKILLEVQNKVKL